MRTRHCTCSIASSHPITGRSGQIRGDTAQQNKRTVQSVFIFRIGKEWLSFAYDDPQRGRRTMIHSLPHQRQRIVVGLTNIRGEFVVCVSLGALLGIDAAPDRQAENTSSNGTMGRTMGRTTGRLGIGVDSPRAPASDSE